MAKRTKPPVELYHDRVANIYDGIYSGSAYWDFYFTITWRHLKKFLPAQRPARALDVGCGTGRWGLRILKSGIDTDFLDISHRMLDQVGNKLATDFPKADSQLFHASIDDLSTIPVETYDFIVGQGDPLSCADNPRSALSQLVGLLKPGGVLVLSVDNRGAGFDHFMEKGDLYGLESFIKSGRTEWLTERHEERFKLTMFMPDEIRKMFSGNGLEVLSLIGKTVLPVRICMGVKKNLLADKKTFQRLMRIEEGLQADESLLCRAAHLEIVGRKPAS